MGLVHSCTKNDWALYRSCSQLYTSLIPRPNHSLLNGYRPDTQNVSKGHSAPKSNGPPPGSAPHLRHLRAVAIREGEVAFRAEVASDSDARLLEHLNCFEVKVSRGAEVASCGDLSTRTPNAERRTGRPREGGVGPTERSHRATRRANRPLRTAPEPLRGMTPTTGRCMSHITSICNRQTQN